MNINSIINTKQATFYLIHGDFEEKRSAIEIRESLIGNMAINGTNSHYIWSIKPAWT